MIASLITNIVQNLYSKKGSKPSPTTPLDFMPDWIGKKKEPKKQSIGEMKRILLGIAKVQNERVSKLKNKKKP